MRRYVVNETYSFLVNIIRVLALLRSTSAVHNAVLSQVLCVMVNCIEVAHLFGHPAAGAKRFTSSPNHVLSAESLFRKLQVFELLWTFTNKNP